MYIFQQILAHIVIERKILPRIEQFYRDNDKKALLIDGVRQCGKTYIIRKYGMDNYDVFLEINLHEDAAARKAVSTSKNSEELMLRLSSLFKKNPVPGKTLIFIDEVQECPDIITMAKFLVDDGRYRYILSGSLLGLELKDVRSVPVGYMDIYDMYPVDLEEFYNAVGVPGNVIDHVRNCFERRIPVDPVVHGRLMDLFRIYMVVGGMPEAVDRYLATNNLRDVMAVQKSITDLYRLDIAKYDPENKLYIRNVFDRIPSELNKKNKRFTVSSVAPNFRLDRDKNTFVWLNDAGVALPVLNIAEPRYPLVASAESSMFKLFLCDVGLLSYMTLDGMQHEVLSGELGMNNGSLFENLVAQELYAHGFVPYYYNSKKLGEVDFMVQNLGRVIPIEVKSGKYYKTHAALDNLLSSEEYSVGEAFVIQTDNVVCDGRTTYIPVYMTMMLKKEDAAGDMTVTPNLEGLK